MRILTRYVLKEVLSHGALGLLLFTFVIFMRDVGRLLELIVRNSAPLPSVAEIFFLTLPTALTITIPMGVLVGILIGLSRLAADSEITAMRATGIGSTRFLVIVSAFSMVAWIFAMLNSVFVAPRSAAALVHLQDSLKSSQASFEVQPRVFYENFTNYVLYVQDTQPTRGAAVWKDVFLADISNPSAPKVTLAQKAVVVNEDQNTLRLHLNDGSQHETLPRNPDQYNITTFAESDVPIELPQTNTETRRDPPAAELTTQELLARSHDSDRNRARWYEIEFNRRLALPTACIVLTLVGVPLGLSSKKGGKSTGFVLTILLVFFYYLVSLAGVAIARQGKVPPVLGVWGANLLFVLTGIFLLYRVDRHTIEIGSVRELAKSVVARFRRAARPNIREERRSAIRRERESFWNIWHFPTILDGYVLRSFLGYVLMVLATFVTLTLIFTFFELLGDIVRNRVPLITVGAYLLNVTPSMIYLMTPLAVLISVLVTFGLMQKSNEMIAMRATGVSVYRAIVPVLVMAAVIAGSLFIFDQFYLPRANTRQEALRNNIKGRPAQTFLRPDRKWIFGQKNTIYYYEHFDPDQNEFASISAFEFDPKSFEITRRIYAQRAHWETSLNKWVLEQGWSRDFKGATVQDFATFDAKTFDRIAEPPTYFKKEVKQSSEMNYPELRRYIADLQQSGFEVARLRVQLYKKLAFPLITLVMAILAVPFSMSAGKRGALTGVAVAIGIAIFYWTSAGLFEALGNIHQLPAAMAAWAPDILFGLAGGYLIFKVPT